MFTRRSTPTSAYVFLVFTCLFGASVLSAGAYSWYMNVDFNQGCGGHLKRAADSNTVTLAKEELNTALKYIEAKHLTSGSTHVLYATPDQDIGFWYRNIKSSYEELGKVAPDTSMLEQTNVLMKLRETLLDHSQAGDSVTVPQNISVFPNNSLFTFWIAISAAFMIGCLLMYKYLAETRYIYR